jgi:glutaredoxin
VLLHFEMRPTRSLFMYTANLTLFTRANCGLCTTAKSTLMEVQKRRTVSYTEIDIMAEGQKQWKDVYEFDVPVLHVERVWHTSSKPNIVSPVKKLMHRFTVDEVEKLVDEKEQGD